MSGSAEVSVLEARYRALLRLLPSAPAATGTCANSYAIGAVIALALPIAARRVHALPRPAHRTAVA